LLDGLGSRFIGGDPFIPSVVIPWAGTSRNQEATMTTFDSDDLDTTGYFLPEDSQLRLKKLREYVEFLSHLAQPRMADEDRECMPEIRAGEVAICLELLAEQIEHLLDEISWPAYRSEREAAAAADAELEAAAPEAPEAEGVELRAAEYRADSTGAPYLFGVTLDQIDEINLLLEMIRAHGDVVIASHEAEFADYTLSLVWHAIFCDAQKLRDIIHDVNEQRLGPMRGVRTGVRDEPAAYHALPVRLPMGSALCVTRQLPTCQYGRRGRARFPEAREA
jgi:hypothetical protein